MNPARLVPLRDADVCAVVVERPIGCASFARSVAELIDGRLDIRAQDAGTLLEAFGPGCWREAKVFDLHGRVRVSFLAGETSHAH